MQTHTDENKLKSMNISGETRQAANANQGRARKFDDEQHWDRRIFAACVRNNKQQNAVILILKSLYCSGTNFAGVGTAVFSP